MEQEETKIEDVEEGEISDSASVEEISEEDFKKQEELKAKSEEGKAKSEARVWTMQDLYKYQYKRGYTSGLYNFAWAQAVQNKPLNEVFDLEEDSSNRSPYANGKDSKSNTAVSKGEGRVVIDVEVDGEKEEGELEEGEIDLDWEPNTKVAGTGKEDSVEEGAADSDNSRTEVIEVAIRLALESVISSNSAISFGGLCTRLQHSLEDLRELVVVKCVPWKDSLLQLYFAAMQTFHGVFCSMDQVKKEHNKEIWRRVLALVVKDDSFLPSKQLKEMEDMLSSLDSPSSSINDNDAQLSDGSIGVLSATPVGYSVNNLSHSSNAAEPMSSHDRAAPSESLKQGFKGRGILIPLLDLHKDHDVDSLPSPTREATPTLNFSRPFSSGDGMFKPELGAHKLANGVEEFRMHPFETQALKALSNYQQKFGRNSSFTTDRLPSPTPSEEHVCGGNDVGEEVSSSRSGNSSTPVLGRSVPPSSSHVENVSMQVMSAARSVAASSVPNLPAKSIPKSRDPRLRFVNSDSGSLDLTQQVSPLINNSSRIELSNGIIGSRKQRHIEDSMMDGPEPKRPRNELGNSGIAPALRNSSGTGGLMEGIAASVWQSTNRGQTMATASDPRKTEKRTTFPMNNNDKANATVASADLQRVPSASAAASLPELLKGIAVNPTVLANLLMLGQQQRLAAENGPKSMSSPLSSRSIATVTVAPPVSTAPMSSGFVQKPAAIPQVPQNTSMDDTGKIRMKPRDPRRILHANALQRSGSLRSEQLTNGIPASRPQVEVPADKRAVASQPGAALDIAHQFTKNLKNVADMISTSQALSSPPVVSPNHVSQPMQTSSGLEAKTIDPNSPELQTGNGPVVDAGSSAPSQPQNLWNDVEHLFEGYDDQQKAAIQRERARRLEEQKKMFADRKLCLVLDLDHTLLNSAKFVEVEPVHEEMLRVKEQEDREKPQRHLFRFPHMGMWTKLRPGVWNFLEKASKLYELHLYTMGNKLYATEMAKVLDPTGVLFAGRVISRGDDGDSVDGDDRYKTKDLEGVMGMESSVVIIDDSVRVWPHNKLNLIVVERYTYFPSSRRQFGLLGPSLLEIDHDERPEDGTLASSLGVVERIHQIFFSHPSLDDLDVRNILAKEQQKILGGCRIVFSRVFPVGDANPHLHPLWQTAEQFGAACTNQLDDQVTHVVANSLGTDKVNWALNKGRFVVHPGWVEASALLYRRANEQDFAIKP